MKMICIKQKNGKNTFYCGKLKKRRVSSKK